jgi:6,7-dimethyl-8-ribityllumazine synthase
LDKTSLGIIVAEFNSRITMEMLEVAKAQAELRNAVIRYICFVPGTFDMPLLIEELIKKKDVDAIVTLGCVIKGETGHDRIVANTAARFIAELSFKYHKPVSLGISGPDMTVQQARNRITTVSRRAVDAAVNMVDRLRKLRDLEEDDEKMGVIIID